MSHDPQLFCFPYAGGTAAFFDIIKDDLPGVEVIEAEYPGHGRRHREPFCRDFDELSDDVCSQIREKYSGGEYGLFGYSMGSISLVEVLKRILDSDMKPPKNVFLAAHEPQARAELSGFSEDELDSWVKDRTIRFGAVPERLMNNSTFWRTYLPVYRADYTMISRYTFEKPKIKTEVPADVFYSETDTPLAEMKQWDDFFTECRFHHFSGSHFFIRDHHEEMGRIIRERLGVRI